MLICKYLIDFLVIILRNLCHYTFFSIQIYLVKFVIVFLAVVIKNVRKTLSIHNLNYMINENDASFSGDQRQLIDIV